MRLACLTSPSTSTVAVSRIKTPLQMNLCCEDLPLLLKILEICSNVGRRSQSFNGHFQQLPFDHTPIHATRVM